MADMALAWNSLAASQWLVGSELAGYEAGPLNGGGPYDYYRTKDGRYLSVGSLEPKFWQGFCEAIGRPDLVEAGAEVRAEVAEAIARKELAEWVEVFGPLDVCVEPVLTVEEALGHPQVGRAGHGGSSADGEWRDAAAGYETAKFSGSETVYRQIGAVLGQHTDEVLAEAGFTAEAIARLHEQGVVR